ncbi:BPSS1780 family membrane protein [Candidatus Pandoraea novymonadis]|uniref:Transmembrane protein n=1 Tax=Candidatus Pandoraea novymonadis TaxID=1808959 RepID=A0ABX5FF51_9BURK|nr:BPSS1780 family membrane protein [Candidatus Pandoraea novymonadis]PSB92294.1 hypothetical protein BZL35_00532 [Candidatus Pandoraea novymonadis]
MQLLKVPPKNGYIWLRQGSWLFRKNPLAILTLLSVYLFSVLLMSILPIAGSFLPLLFIPGLSVGFMAACRDIIQKKPILPTILLEGFRNHGKITTRNLLILGSLYIASIACIFIFSALFDGGQLLRLMIFGAQIDSEFLANREPMLGAMLATAVAYIPITMLFWFAPVLVAWHEISPVKAMFFSWTACVRNSRAFIVYGLFTALVATLVPMVIGIIMLLLNLGKFLALVLMPYSIVLTAIIYCSFYASYLGCFNIQ